MDLTIGIDFEKLDLYITSLKSLLEELEEPSYESLEFWVGGTTGSGMVLNYLYDFCNRTIDYHEAVFHLITNTITYLESVKKLKDVDNNIAERL